MRNTIGTPHFQKRVTGVRPVTQWKLSNTGVLDIVMLLHAANQSSVFKVCGPSENRPTEGPASLSGKWEVQSKLDFSASTHPSPAQGPRLDHPKPTPHPSSQINPNLAIIPSNPNAWDFSFAIYNLPYRLMTNCKRYSGCLLFLMRVFCSFSANRGL